MTNDIENQPAPGATPAPPSPQTPPAAAKLVAAPGGPTEKEISAAQALRAREIRIAELEDENHRLKQTLTPPPPPPPAAKKSILDGWTLLDAEEND